MSNNKTLNAENLKEVLWDTLGEIRSGKTDPHTANAIASQARSIIGTIKVEIQIQNSINALSQKVKKFTS